MRRTMIRIAAAAGVLLAALPAAAQMAAGTEPAAFWERAIAWIMAQQRAFHEELTEALRRLNEDGGAAAAWALIAASFLYGIFHAAGPGHGKAVLATWLVTTRQRMRRGLALAAAAALCQALSAIVLVYGLIFAAGWLPRETSDAIDWSERASFLLVMLMGAWLLARAGRSGLAALRRRAAACDHHAHHDHHGDHHHQHHACAHSLAAAGAERTHGLRGAALLVLSIGLRPCTGAVLVLVFAHVAGIAWAGVAAVLAMAGGTALASAALAVVAVSLRNWASARVGARGGVWAVAGQLVGAAGGALLVAIGVSLLAASFAPSHPLGL